MSRDSKIARKKMILRRASKMRSSYRGKMGDRVGKKEAKNLIIVKNDYLIQIITSIKTLLRIKSFAKDFIFEHAYLIRMLSDF